MYIRKKTSPKTKKTSVQIVESYRNKQGKPRQRIVQHIGMAIHPDDIKQLVKLAEHIKARLRHDTQPAVWSPKEMATMVIASKAKAPQPPRQMVNTHAIHEENRIILGFHEIYGKLYRELGFDRLLAPSRFKAANRILYNMVMARLARPEATRASVQRMAYDFGISIPVHKVYRMMDTLNDKFIDRLQQRIADQSLELLARELDVIYCDCTTLYFESVADDDLRQFGYSKDGKSREVQILLALMTTREGLPVGYQVFPGANWEGASYLPMRQSLLSRHPDITAVHVADAGLMTDANLTAIENDNEHYIMGARLRSLPTRLKEQILNTHRYRSLHGTEYSIGVFRYKGRRLVVSYSPARARKDAADRQRAVDKLLKKLANSDNPREMMGRGGRWRYIKLMEKSRVVLDEDKLRYDARWDGLHGVITNLRNIPATELLARYRGLWRIEESFRIAKTDLRIRPIYHWTASRIKAHIALCFMAFSLIRHLGHRLAGLDMRLSPRGIRDALAHQQCSIVRDDESGQRYVIPSTTTKEGKAIYKAMGVKMGTTAYALYQDED